VSDIHDRKNNINHKHYGLEKSQPLLRRAMLGAAQVFSMNLK
jgi:hypothetical protein